MAWPKKAQHLTEFESIKTPSPKSKASLSSAKRMRNQHPQANRQMCQFIGKPDQPTSKLMYRQAPSQA